MGAVDRLSAVEPDEDEQTRMTVVTVQARLDRISCTIAASEPENMLEILSAG